MLHRVVAAIGANSGPFALLVCAAAWLGNVPVALGSTAQQASTTALASLGAKIFSNRSLSISGHQSCATCHSPAHAHAQDNPAAVQAGGKNLDVTGFRAVPSLRYLNFNVPFFFASDGTLLAAHEMANVDAASAVARLAQSENTEQFRELFGQDLFVDSDLAFLAMRYALSVSENGATQFRPFSSKFDLFFKDNVPLGAE